MTPINKIIKSLSATCEECGAEVVITPICSPSFRDLSPLCPYCHFPMTKEQTTEEIIAELTKMTAQLEARVKEERL